MADVDAKVNPGTEDAGKHLTGTDVTNAGGSNGGGATVDTTNALVPELLKTKFDERVVKMGFSTTPMNAMTRDMGYRAVKSMVYGYWSVDLRKTEDMLKEAVAALTAKQADRKEPARMTIKVVNNTLFDKTDVISFKDVPGYTADGTELKYVPLNARVCAIGDDGETLTVQFLNAKAGVTIPANTPVFILGHAAGETDASTVPYSALPTKKEQYMQKFMVQSLISSVMMESEKEVEWGKVEINELLMQQFIEDIEKFMIFGTKSYTYDAQTKTYTRTMSGILEQMMEGGSKVIDLYKDDLEYKDLLDAVNETFVGNTGSPKRYMFNGCNVAPAIWGIKDVTKNVTVKEFKNCFGYDFSGIDMLGYQLVHVPDPLLDKLECKDWAIVLDRQYVERRVFRTLEETAIELKKTGTYDGDSTVWSEISSVVLKYPKVHALWHFHDGKKPTASTGESEAGGAGA